MAKFNPASELDKYASSGGYFSLSDDGDTATVRFMYNGIDDIDGYAVHKVNVEGRDRYVNCLRSYSDPLEACPLCEARHRIQAKFFIPLYMEDSGEIKIWERGQNFYSKLTELCSAHVPLVSHPIEIERNGAKGDINTTYETYVQPSDGTLLEDLPEIPNPIGTIVLDKNYDELLTYVQTGSFETGDSNPVNQTNNLDVRRRRDVSASAGVRRRGSGNSNVPL